ncbi:MAG: hypothetical protein PF694_03005 [Bacteroidetes bacterium]|jgi:hypothetical protein|nr:hypothetical protein [Bacteroidota bacterium]
MQKYTHIVKYLTILIISGLLFSCEIETSKTVSIEEAVKTVTENAEAAAIFKDIFNEVNDAAFYADDSLSGKYKKGQFNSDDEPIITITPFDYNTWPKTITVDYGEHNMACTDMRERRGVIEIIASDFYRNPGCELEISFNEFYQNDYKIEGYKHITYQGDNEEGNPVYLIQVNAGEITTPEDLSYSFEQNLEQTWIEGQLSESPWDDVYLITGNQEGLSSDSVSYTILIENENPLNVRVGCRWIREGILSIKIDDFQDIKLDYGEGVCDNAATVTIYGDEYLINMQ